jgi:CheY-like chemotaxis protein
LALSAFKQAYYDLLILDIKMPKIDGYELYDKIRKIDDKVKNAKRLTGFNAKNLG